MGDTFSLNIWSLVFLLGAMQGLILFIYSLFKVKKSRSYLFLSLLFLVFSLIMTDQSLRSSELYKSAAFLLYTSDGLWYLIAPLIYFYVLFRVDHDYQLRWYQAFHLMPFLVAFIWYFELFSASKEVKIYVLESFISAGAEFGILIKLSILLMMIQILAYLYLSFAVIRKYEVKYKNHASSDRISVIVKLKQALLFFLVYFLIEFSFSSVRNFLNLRNEFFEKWSLGVWVIFIYVISYVIIKDSAGEYPKLNVEKDKIIDRDEDLNAEVLKLKGFMIDEKPYLNAELKLPELAESLGYSTHQLSYLINQGVGVNFYEFVNKYRVIEVKERLSDPDFSHYSINGIAQKTGFNSKASFYRFFKKEFRVTPTAYLKQLE